MGHPVDRAEEERAAPVESRERVDVDRSANRVGVHVRRHRLRHLDRGDHLGREEVERRGAALGAGGEGLPVERDVAEVRLGAPDGDEAALAAVGLDRHARYAADGLGHVLVGKLADGVGGEDFDEVQRLPLLGEGAELLAAQPLHDDLAGPKHFALQLEVFADPRATRHLHRRLSRTVADKRDDERLRARRHAAQAEAALAVGRRPDVCALNDHVRTRQRAAARDLDDAASDDAARSILRVQRAGRQREEEHLRGERSGQKARGRCGVEHESLEVEKRRAYIFHILQHSDVRGVGVISHRGDRVIKS